MHLSRFQAFLRNFFEETRGSLMVEAVITIPLLFWMIAATFEFFEVHRYKSVREKATFTLADMISRETSPGGITSVYIDNAKVLFDEITNDSGVNQIRVSVISYDADSNEYGIAWSQVRGSGSLAPLTDGEVRSAHASLPVVSDGEEIILIESISNYDPLFNVGINDVTMQTRVFSAIRFAPQICYEGTCGLHS
ncbi:TadE/TadG family type IV pilus assembly protein [Roseovarius aestuariivivens]|uniref:TadE/TadG family type IV pilus assembly protein n=1 Tax=Roseovarius aestuariivivens TaxID=1888910 RepID=UPI001081094E|nr:pilus assembly protein [Roseovarius aestuariivivens]